MHHNVTSIEELPYGAEMLYKSGLKDLCAVFFYTLIGIVVHAVIQEYILDVRIFFNIHFKSLTQFHLIFLENQDKTALVQSEAKQVQ